MILEAQSMDKLQVYNDLIGEHTSYDILLSKRNEILAHGKEWHQIDLEGLSEQLVNSNRYLQLAGRKFIVEKTSINEDATWYKLSYITKEIESELYAEIAESRDFFERILENLPVDIAMFDLNHTYRYVSKTAIRNEETRKWIIGKTDYDYAEWKGMDTTIAKNRRVAFDKIVQDKKVTAGEDLHVLADGTEIWMQRNFIPIFDDSGNLKEVLGFGLNITDIKHSELAAKKSESNYIKLFENNLIGVFQSDISGNYLNVNNAYAAIFGFESADELIGKTYLDLVIDDKPYLEMLSQFKEKGTLSNYTMFNKLKNGKEVWTMINASLNREDGGIVEGTLLDITAQKRDEQAKNKAFDKLRLLESFINHSADGLQVSDETGRLIFLNKTSSARLGIDQDDSSNFYLKDFQPYFKEEENWKKHLEELANTPLLKVQTEHLNIRTKKKTPVELSVTCKEINGKRYIIASSIDITERLVYERKLAETNRFLEIINNAINSTSLVTETDIFGNIVFANENFCKVSGYGMDELIGKNHNIVNSGHHSSEFWGDFWKCIRDGRVWTGEIKNKAKDGSFYWVKSTVYPVIGDKNQITGYLSVRQDVTDLKEATERLDYVNIFQQHLMGLATEVINLPMQKVSNTFNTYLERIGEFVGADRAWIFDYDFTHSLITSRNVWARDRNDFVLEFGTIPMDPDVTWTERHQKGEIVEVKDVSMMENCMVKTSMQQQGVKSVITIPLMSEGKCLGFLGFDSLRIREAYSEDEKNLLFLFAQVIVNAKLRSQNLKNLLDAKQEIEKMNKSLASEVDRQTAQNTELSRILAEQELLASIGEMAAGVAHDLNTPLGAIKAGAENVRLTLETIFHKLVLNVDEDQLNFVCKRAETEQTELFIGGLQARKETTEFLTYFKDKGMEESEATKLAKAMVKARVQLNDISTIEYALSVPNPYILLELMYHMQTVRNLVSTILTSSDKANSVIKNIRSFIQINSNSGFLRLNLQQNINTVLSVFNHQLKHNFRLNLQVDPQLYIHGKDVSLYQLWSNLIKNAIDVAPKHSLLEIIASEDEQHIYVAISNEGPMIPEEIREQIFKKFYTTKKESNGTGLGLSIVKRTVEEHKGRIQVDSNEQRTTFTVTFMKNLSLNDFDH